MPDFRETSDEELWALSTDVSDLSRAEAILELGHRQFQRENYDEAIGLLSAAQEIFKEIGDDDSYGTASFFAGVTLTALKRWEDAVLALGDAAEVFRIRRSEIFLADALKYKAEAHVQLDQDEAVADYLSAANLFDSNGRKTTAGICLLDLGDFQGAQGKQSAALETVKNALAIFQSGSDFVGSGRAHDKIAAALIDLGRPQEGIEHLREALSIFEYIQDARRMPYAQYRLGWTLVGVSENYEAIPLLRRAVTDFKSQNRFIDAANADTQLAHALLNIGEADEALALYESTRIMYVAAGEQNLALIADVNAAIRYMDDDADTALMLLGRALAGATGEENLWLANACKVRMSECYVKTGDQSLILQGLTLLEEIDSEDFGDNVQDLARFRNARASSLVELQRFDEAEKELTGIVSRGSESGLLQPIGEANWLLSVIFEARGDSEASADFLTRAIALYLASGSVGRATELSKRFLPQAVPQARDILFQDSTSVMFDQTGHKDENSDSSQLL
jgi:tetratricopeptide (TPR) repeat protein